MGTIQYELAVSGLVTGKKAALWEDINTLKPEHRRMLKEKAELNKKDKNALERIDFRIQSISKQIQRLKKLAEA
jgi:predicted  nucleic acid-binding Zn-ribbon protein